MIIWRKGIEGECINRKTAVAFFAMEKLCGAFFSGANSALHGFGGAAISATLRLHNLKISLVFLTRNKVIHATDFVNETG
jgi:shikimate 5-dehydrogenase